MNTNSKVVVRFAPSPTGILHVGGIRTALFNFFFAKSQGGQFILRNEDTDQARKVEGSLEATLESFRWLNISWDELITQSERLLEYKKYADQLVSLGKAVEEEGAIRFKVDPTGKTSWIDMVGNKEISFESSDIEDFIILKKDGFPTYHLANVVDDHLLLVSHVIRGEDWISSTPKHIMLYKSLGWAHPIFAHVPNVMGADGKKLSKRKGAKSVLDFKKEGILSSALLNYLMLLGWSPKNDREILSKEEMEKEFKLENIQVSSAVFDEKKLLWMNGEYIRRSTISNLQFLISNFDKEIASIPNFEQYVPLAQTRMKTLAEFRDLVQNNDTVELSGEQKKLAKELLDVYSGIKDWNKENLMKVSFEVRDKTGSSTKDLYMVLTGKPQGLPLFEKLELEGSSLTLEYLKRHI